MNNRKKNSGKRAQQVADIVVQFLINVIEMSIQLSTTQRIHNRKISWSFSTENRVHYFVILRNVMVMARKVGVEYFGYSGIRCLQFVSKSQTRGPPTRLVSIIPTN